MITHSKLGIPSLEGGKEQPGIASRKRTTPERKTMARRGSNGSSMPDRETTLRMKKELTFRVSEKRRKKKGRQLGLVHGELVQRSGEEGSASQPHARRRLGIQA